jgi:hypothetical protein
VPLIRSYPHCDAKNRVPSSTYAQLHSRFGGTGSKQFRSEGAVFILNSDDGFEVLVRQGKLQDCSTRSPLCLKRYMQSISLGFPKLVYYPSPDGCAVAFARLEELNEPSSWCSG